MSSWMESMYSCSSLIGFVSSKRRWQRPPNSCAIPKLSAIDLGWPMWRYPFGSGGKRVTTSETLPSRTSAATISRMKSLRPGVAGPWPLASLLLIVAQSSPGGSAGVLASRRCSGCPTGRGRLGGYSISPKRGIKAPGAAADYRSSTPFGSRGDSMTAGVQTLRVAPQAAPEPTDAEALAERVLELLEQRGVPSGAWLVDIAQVR